MSYKGQALTLEFASKMITHVQEAKQQQVELVTIAIDTDLVLQGSASNSQIGRKAVCYLCQTIFLKVSKSKSQTLALCPHFNQPIFKTNSDAYF